MGRRRKLQRLKPMASNPKSTDEIPLAGLATDRPAATGLGQGKVKSSSRLPLFLLFAFTGFLILAAGCGGIWILWSSTLNKANSYSSQEIAAMEEGIKDAYSESEIVVEFLGGIDSVEYDSYASSRLADANPTAAFQVSGPKGNAIIVVRELSYRNTPSASVTSPASRMAYLRDDSADVEHVIGSFE